MPIFTVQNIVDRAAAIADMHDLFVTPAQWLAWFNTERKALQLFKARLGTTTQNIESFTVVAPDRLSLTSVGVNEILAIVGVWEITSTGRFRPLRIVNYPDNFIQDQGGPITGPAQTVIIEDHNNDNADVNTILRFFPRDTTGTYSVVYYKAPNTLTSLSDTFSESLGLEERIVLGMAKKALIKEESDTEAIDELIKEETRRVEEFVWMRAFAQTPAVRNVDKLQRGWMTTDGFVTPNPETWYWL